MHTKYLCIGRKITIFLTGKAYHHHLLCPAAAGHHRQILREYPRGVDLQVHKVGKMVIMLNETYSLVAVSGCTHHCNWRKLHTQYGAREYLTREWKLQVP